MSKPIVIKNHHHEIQLITQRSWAMLILMGILIGLLLLRLSYLQLIKHNLYTTLSQKNSLDLSPLEPTRGLIYDRRGVLLAENIPVFSLDITPYKVSNLTKTLIELGKIISLTDTELAQFAKQLKQHRRFDEIPLKVHLTESDVAHFYENQYRFSGVVIKARLMRHYPFNTQMSHVLGYVGRINADELKTIDTTNYSGSNYIGKLGIEQYYENKLHGKVGYEQVENDASGEPVRTLKRIKPIPGENLYLTIDSQLQTIAEKALSGNRGAIVMMDPNTGEILAMVSEPGFDPNTFVTGISNQAYQALQASPDRPLYDRSLRGLYPMASTIKPFIALQGLNTGTITADFSLFDPGWFQLPNSAHIFYDWRHLGHGTVTLFKALVSSCDTYFFALATKLGIQRIDDILMQFGFGQLTGIDLNNELPGVIASPAWKLQTKKIAWYPGDTLNSGIGQGFMQATPLQLAAAVSAIATHGKRVQPHLLLSENDLRNVTPSIVKTPVHLQQESNWTAVIDAMQGVITSPEGTGRLHFGRPPSSYTLAAKTGTAQVHAIKRRSDGYSEERNQSTVAERFRDHSLFIAFAPVDHPRIAIAIIVENSVLAAGIAHTILDNYFGNEPHVNTPKTSL